MLYWYKEGHRQLMFAPASSQTGPVSAPAKPTQQESWPQAAALVAQSDFRYSSSNPSDISPAINKLFTMPISPDQLSMPNYSNNYFNDRIYVDSQGTLNIINATSSDNGFYACALISSVGSVMAKAKLTVRRSPAGQSKVQDQFDAQDQLTARTSVSTPSNSKFDLLPPPVIKLGAANQTLPTNTSAILVCEVVSQVAYKIQWFFESLPLQEDIPRVTVLDSGALSINNLKTSDSGVYTCVVTAATDQTLSVASPFEPLDSSMLTSAPPIPQSTSHSTTLKVASPLNPNIQFYRMDNFAYPSSPGIAYLVSTNGNDAITIAWSAPADSGSLPIKEYVVEHFDTSQEHMGWTVIYRIKGKESLLIDGLSSEGSHFFVIRAANSRGTGPSSPIAGPYRTEAGEARYRSELQRRRITSDPRLTGLDNPGNTRVDVSLARDRLMTISTTLLNLSPVTSTSIKLQWSVQMNGSTDGSSSASGFTFHSSLDVENFLEGYSIRYRAIGMGESLLSREPFLGSNLNTWPSFKESSGPTSLPLVTSYLDPREESVSRYKRDLLQNSYDFSQEFNEVRVADHNTEHYTINGLRPFTLYQFFVVPYYKDVDGVPSNILTAQTNEDKPSVAPHLIVRPINSTAVRLLWLHVPPIYANGILRGYVVQVNRTGSTESNGAPAEFNIGKIAQSDAGEFTKILNLPLSSLNVASLSSLTSDTRVQMSGIQQYVVMYDLTNLTYKSFYSIQVAATTNVGHGPWSDPQNFIMDPKILSQPRSPASDFDDVMSKSLISTIPQNYNPAFNSASNPYVILSIVILIISVFLVLGYVVYQRNNQKVITWKKTISEHLTNKFYMPSSVDHRGANSLQQNIYDHQQHLIYSGSAHIVPQPIAQQALWSNTNGCINSSGTGSLSSNGGLLQINNDPSNMVRRMNNDQIMMIPSNDTISKFGKPNMTSVIASTGLDQARATGHHSQIIHHGGDYYSVINNISEYEELDSQQKNHIPLIGNNDRQLTASSNSDTSCPSSVTRLLPNQNFNRELLTSKTLSDNHRHELILQQQVGCVMGGPEQATLISGDNLGQHSVIPLSPYATTNLMNQIPIGNQKQLFNNAQANLPHHMRQNNFVPGTNMTMDDSSKVLMSHQQQMNAANNLSGLFRTLQRNPANFQVRNQQQFSPTTSHQIFVHPDAGRLNDQINSSSQFGHGQQPINHGGQQQHVDPRLNLYEHIDYSMDSPSSQQMSGIHAQTNNNNPRSSNGIVSSSTSSGSVKSGSQQQSSMDLQSGVKSRRGPLNLENETHDLRVFTKPPPLVPRQTGGDTVADTGERNRGGGGALEHQTVVAEDRDEDEGETFVDETTAFRQKSSTGDSQRSRQLSKRKRQQQRNRLHNNNQKVS